MSMPPPETPAPGPPRRRRLRAVFAADVANYGGLVSIDETNTLDGLTLLRRIAIDTLADHGGWLFGLPGDGIFALFESAIDAVRCGLDMQRRLGEVAQLDHLKLRIGIHLGEVVFENEMPFGEALVVAARLESLAEPGRILVSSPVRDAVVLRINAQFQDRGIRPLKHSPRSIGTFEVLPAVTGAAPAILDESTGTGGLAPTAEVASLDPAPEPVTVAAPPVPPAPVSLSDTVRVPVPLADPAPVPEPQPVPVEVPVPVPVQVQVPVPVAEPAPPVPPVHRDPGERPAMPALPRVQPFVIPGAALDETNGLSRSRGAIRVAAKPQPAPPAAPSPEVQACLPDLIAALTVHIGPLARVIGPRAAAQARSPSDLVARLAEEVRSEPERKEFMAKASGVLRRFGA